MTALKRHPLRHGVIDEFCPLNHIRRHPLFYPFDYSGQHVGFGCESHSGCCGSAALTNYPGAWAGIAMKHAGNAKEAEEVIKCIGGALHTSREAVVESLRVEACDLIILTAMKTDDLATRIAKCGEIIRPGSDV